MISFPGIFQRLGRIPLDYLCILWPAFGRSVTVVYCFYLEYNWTKFRKETPVAKTLELKGVLEFCGTLSFLLFLQIFLLDLQAFLGGRNLTVYDPLIWQKSNVGQEFALFYHCRCIVEVIFLIDWTTSFRFEVQILWGSACVAVEIRLRHHCSLVVMQWSTSNNRLYWIVMFWAPNSLEVVTDMRISYRCYYGKPTLILWIIKKFSNTILEEHILMILLICLIFTQGHLISMMENLSQLRWVQWIV